MYDFGLTGDQFWALTPPQFSALSARFDQANRQLDLRAALVASTVANSVRAPDSTPWTPQDFLPRYEGDEEPESEMTADDILSHLQAAFPQRPPEDRG